MILFLFSIAFIDSVLIGAQVGICFYDLTGDSFLLCYHHDQNFLPASNLKLFTTASALFLLGPDFRFQTRFALDSDTNLYILGGGDPTLSRAKLLHELKQITQRFPIQRIFLHGRAIHGFRYPWGWSWHYLDAAYAPRLSGIILDKNTFELILKPGTEVGETINYTYRPQLNDILIVNRATTYPPDSGFKIDLYRELGANRVHLYGGIGLSSPDKKIPISLADPLQSHRELIARMLGCEVLILSGEDSLPELTTIDSILSPPLIEILQEMNTESENIYAEAILNRLANAETTRSTLNAGIQAEKNLLVRLGIDTTRLAIYDGSGLSRFNRITPLAMVRLLYALYHSRYREQFLSLLPTGGEGTLWYRFKTEKNRIRCKTGTLYGVSCLSGYILKPRPIAFAILINDFLTPRRDIEKWQESLCRRYLQ